MDKILIENLSLNYSDGTESLRNVNLNIPANAIIGAIWTSRRGKIHPTTSDQPAERSGRRGLDRSGKVMLADSSG